VLTRQLHSFRTRIKKALKGEPDLVGRDLIEAKMIKFGYRLSEIREMLDAEVFQRAIVIEELEREEAQKAEQEIKAHSKQMGSIRR